MVDLGVFLVDPDTPPQAGEVSRAALNESKEVANAMVHAIIWLVSADDVLAQFCYGVCVRG